MLIRKFRFQYNVALKLYIRVKFVSGYYCSILQWQQI